MVDELTRQRILIASLKRDNERLAAEAKLARELIRRIGALEVQVAQLMEANGLEPTRQMIALERKPKRT